MTEDILYKYRSLSGENKGRVERIFTHNELYFPSPLQFNDPFDCRVDLSLEGTKEEWVQYINGLIKKYRPNLSPADRLQFKKRLMRSGGLKNIDAEVLHKLNQEIGVFSLSEVADDILMWSHYADSHQGICIGFRAGPEDYFFRISQEVIYRPDYPATRVHDGDIERMEATILTKSDHWSYEREFRIVDYETGPGIKTFPPHLLTCVILGCKISESDRRMVLKWAKRHPSAPLVYQATKGTRRFALDIVQIAYQQPKPTP